MAATQQYNDLTVKGVITSNTSVIGSLAGILKATTGTVGTATSGTDYLAPPVIASLSANTTLTTQEVVFATGTITLILQTAVTWEPAVLIKNIGTGSITIQGPSSQTIDGATTQTLNTQYSSYTLIPNGTNWFIF